MVTDSALGVENPALRPICVDTSSAHAVCINVQIYKYKYYFSF